MAEDARPMSPFVGKPTIPHELRLRATVMEAIALHDRGQECVCSEHSLCYMHGSMERSEAALDGLVAMVRDLRDAASAVLDWRNPSTPHGQEKLTEAHARLKELL